MQNRLNRAMKTTFFFACLFILTGKIQAQPLQVDGIIAVVGDKVVLRSDFETDFAQLMRSGQVKDSLETVCMVFRRLVTRKMMLNQA